MTGPTFYNSLTRRVEELHPLHGQEVCIYACGPTVYWFAHIGNMRTYVFVDVLRRTLEATGYEVNLVMNITDVGHLTDDGDAGEDKMLVAMRKEGKSAYDIAAFYTDAFVKDMARLNIGMPTKMPKATEHISEQIAMIQQLEQNGFAYRTEDGMYFDTSKLADYGKLSGQKAEDKLAGARVDMGGKKNPTDFALWKFSPADSKREMEWPSPWGVGFPGWHIECSAMSKKYLGVPFDIHTGGIDHIPVHHENEIAQTMGADGVLEANVWMHGEFLTVDGGKMSKSLGNLYTLDDLITRGFDPLAFRYLCLQAHYRTKLNFTFEALEGAQNALKKLRELVRGWDASSKASDDLLVTFIAEVVNDLDTPKALATMWKLVDDAQPTAAKAWQLTEMDKVLGLGLAEYIGKKVEVSDDVKMLMQARDAARAAKDWKESDRLRDQIAASGFIVEDTAEGTRVKPA